MLVRRTLSTNNKLNSYEGLSGYIKHFNGIQLLVHTLVP